MRLANGKRVPMIEVRPSGIHGKGVFALRHIPKGTRIIEYIGERVSHAEADRRYEGKGATDNHTFLFIVDRHTVIDAGVGGNAARFINHCCAPNCETVIEDRRVFIHALRAIEPGEELVYDYLIQREDEDPPDVEQVFRCRCGAPTCRGNMLAPPRMPRRSRAAKYRSASRARRAG